MRSLKIRLNRVVLHLLFMERGILRAVHYLLSDVQSTTVVQAQYHFYSNLGNQIFEND
jgi:hypothetical protein